MLLDRQKVSTMTATPAAMTGPMDAARVLSALASVDAKRLLTDSASAAAACAEALDRHCTTDVANAVESLRKHHAERNPC